MRARSCSFRFFVCERVAGIAARQKGRERPRARTAPEPVQTGRGEVWFGLVWIPTPLFRSRYVLKRYKNGSAPPHTHPQLKICISICA